MKRLSGSVFQGQAFGVVSVSNSTISNFVFNSTAKSISFSVSATTGSTGFCNVIIPEALLGPPYTVKIDNIQTEPVISSNGTHTVIHLNYTHSVHAFKIVGFTVIPEFSANALLLFSVFALSFLTILIKKRKNHKG